MILLILILQSGTDVSGRVEYTRTGVRANGRTVSWSRVASLNETPADPDALRAEAERRSARADSSARAHAALGTWCREQGLKEEARRAFARAVELDPGNDVARRGLSYARDGDAWKPARDLLTARLRAADDAKRLLTLADWCRDHALFEEEWRILVGLAAADGRDKEVIRRVKERTARREPKTDLLPPLRGRWQAFEDRTRHHQAKIWAITAIDFVRVDGDGKLFRGTGRSLSDHTGFGAPVHAAADGIVTRAEGDFEDLTPPRLGRYDRTNTVTIRHPSGEHTDYAHLKQGSVTVKVGDRVVQGRQIGRVGNSGRSGMPHLHFTLMIPATGEAGRGAWIGVPYAFRDFKLVKVGRKPCDIEVKRARPQEGWTMLFPDKAGR